MLYGVPEVSLPAAQEDLKDIQGALVRLSTA